MKILIAAIGKAKSASPERQLYLDYTKRLTWKIDCREFEVKNQSGEQRKQRESELLLEACKGYGCLIALDESGEAMSSREFASAIEERQRKGCSSFAFMIGGSDGLSAAALKQSQLRLSLGRVTWPHLLVRAMLAEQLYRAQSLIANHPYHRD